MFAEEPQNTLNPMVARLSPRAVQRLEEMKRLKPERRSMGMTMATNTSQMGSQQMSGYDHGVGPQPPSFPHGSFHNMEHQAIQNAYPSPRATSFPTYNNSMVGRQNMACNMGNGWSGGNPANQYCPPNRVGEFGMGCHPGVWQNPTFSAPSMPPFGMGEPQMGGQIGASPNFGPRIGTSNMVNRCGVPNNASPRGPLAPAFGVPTDAPASPTAARPYCPRTNGLHGQSQYYKNSSDSENLPEPRVVLHNPQYDSTDFPGHWFRNISAGDIYIVRKVVKAAAFVENYKMQAGWVPKICFQPLEKDKACACPPCTADPACPPSQRREDCSCACGCLREEDSRINDLKADLKWFVEKHHNKPLQVEGMLLQDANRGQPGLGMGGAENGTTGFYCPVRL
ncbi:hypothetical protein ONS95_000758 [Cadophora gregata]|uniref:uncharacterized protein n=1 Tax=Cadophora gregata TaxID=51156 RepID=UPI0026DB54E0|nr:uncharacterized protein ONS95_000758 [Cadophora gregata]KAK0103065.1 hypothetical protein ONS96_005676 [Cadophora gregata f. sp. sojae]KAK0128808.1 hypothetical protein ONS95_000758 [Cadophora gregata]